MNWRGHLSVRPQPGLRPGWFSRVLSAFSDWLFTQTRGTQVPKGDAPFSPAGPDTGEAASAACGAEPLDACSAELSAEPPVPDPVTLPPEVAPSDLANRALAQPFEGVLPPDQPAAAIEIAAERSMALSTALETPIQLDADEGEAPRPEAQKDTAEIGEIADDAADAQPALPFVAAVIVGEAIAKRPADQGAVDAKAFGISEQPEGTAISKGSLRGDTTVPADPVHEASCSSVELGVDGALSSVDLDAAARASEGHSNSFPDNSGQSEHADVGMSEHQPSAWTSSEPVRSADKAPHAESGDSPPPCADPGEAIADSGEHRGVDTADVPMPAAEPNQEDKLLADNRPGGAGAATKPLPKYRPQLREKQGRGATKQMATKASTSVSQDSSATLEADLCLEFQPADWGMRLSLLLRRPDALPEELTVQLLGRELALATIDGGLFEPIPLTEDDAPILWQGVSAETREGSGRRWVRSGRPLHVFSERAGVSGFASVPRAITGQENILLCEDALGLAVLSCCSMAGSPAPQEIQGPGVPSGWRCFRGYRPQISGTWSDIEDMFLALNPLPHAAIELSGGIAVSRSAWIAGRPPAIRILGSKPNSAQVMIDGEAATRDAADQWAAPGWDAVGAHIIRYAGLSRRYEIIETDQEATWWPAHAGSSGLKLAGALAAAEPEGVLVVLAGPASWLIGANPGEVAWAASLPGGLSAVAAPSFVPVWAITPKSGRHRAAPRLLANWRGPGTVRPAAKAELRSWCELIRSGARLPEAESGEEAAALWRLYRDQARTLRRRLR